MPGGFWVLALPREAKGRPKAKPSKGLQRRGGGGSAGKGPATAREVKAS